MAASASRRTKADHIAVWIWPRSNHYVGSQILKGIQTSMGSRPTHRIVVGHASGTSWDDIVASEARFLENLAVDESCAGAIIWYVGGTANRAHLERVGRAEVPVVFVDRLPEVSFPCDYVGTDNVGSAAAVVQHLLESGHRRVACITNLDHASSVTERIQGWREAHAKLGITVDESLLIQPKPSPENLPEECYVENQLSQVLDLSSQPTALFCINDTLAITVIETLTAWGKKVPEDFSVCGFDGMMAWMPGGGGLSGAAQNFERIGQTAVRLLQERIVSPKPIGRQVLLDAPLRLNGSTAPAGRRPDPVHQASASGHNK